MKFKKAAIVGPGLIGGSIGMILRRNKIARTVMGVARRRSTLTHARQCGAIDRGTLSLAAGVRDADLIVLATPVQVILDCLPQLADCVRAGTVVLDVGSTKQQVVDCASRVLPDSVFFVGTHPMAGSEKTGCMAGSVDLFTGSICFVTPTAETDVRAAGLVRRLWQTLGARVVELSPARHDVLVGQISHLPHAVSAALMNSVDPDSAVFGAGGLRDTTRIAAGDPVLWRDVFLSNRTAVLSALETFGRQLRELTEALRAGDAERLSRCLSDAQRLRKRLDRRRSASE